MTSAYASLCDLFQRLSRLEHLSAISGWDMYVMMSSKGSTARAEAMAELELEIQARLAAPRVAELLSAAEQESLDDDQRADLVEMKRRHAWTTALPPALVEAKSLAGARCEHAWRRQRPANDWTGFAANLREVVRLAREEASIRAELTGLGRYDALLDHYEPGMRAERLDPLFADLSSWLPALIERALERQARVAETSLEGSFDPEAQRRLGLEVMALLGFDFEAGRLDVSAHPFCGGVPSDVRITTRFDEGDFLPALMSVIHETGHARYEQNLPSRFHGRPIGLARSMGMHESQSLSFEMQLARSDAFLSLLQPMVSNHFGRRPGLELEALARRVRRVAPGRIRVDADELCYPAHVMLRYQIERALIEGELEVDDIPAAWDERMLRYLGVDTRGDYRNGCMQDIHWTDGGFGYFPTYTLGAIYAAQLFAAARQALPGLDERIADGELGVLFGWLDANVWSHGSRYSTDELLRRATGAPVSTQAYRAHLERRYT